MKVKIIKGNLSSDANEITDLIHLSTFAGLKFFNSIEFTGMMIK